MAGGKGVASGRDGRVRSDSFLLRLVPAFLLLPKAHSHTLNRIKSKPPSVLGRKPSPVM